MLLWLFMPVDKFCHAMHEAVMFEQAIPLASLTTSQALTIMEEL